MDSSPSNITQYDSSSWQGLIDRSKQITTFAEVREWDARAAQEIDRIVGECSRIESEVEKHDGQLARLRDERAQLPFLKRVVASRKPEKDLEQKTAELRKSLDQLGQMGTQLQETIDFTPNSKEEQKALIAELRHRKKELQIQKREAAASVRVVNAVARQESANADNVFNRFIGRQYIAAQRRDIRYRRAAVLRNHEDWKLAVDRQINQLDRDISWAQRFRD